MASLPELPENKKPIYRGRRTVKRHKTPPISGIYKITCTVTGKYYIGSSKDIRFRWYGHKSLLRKGKHHSRYMQYSWNKYGASAFEFTILEECPVKELLAREQFYLTMTGCHGSRIGFNNSYEAGRSNYSRAKRRTRGQFFVVTPPNGKPRRIRNLRLYCDAHGLDAPAMATVAAAKCIVTEQGWKCRRATETEQQWQARHEAFLHAKRDSKSLTDGPWIVQCPDGSEETVADLVYFSSVHNLRHGELWKASRGIIASHLGYRCWPVSSNLATVVNLAVCRQATTKRVQSYTVINPSGVIFTVTHLRVFCKEHGLSVTSMYRGGTNGWRCTANRVFRDKVMPTAKSYIVTWPDGREEHVVSLFAFCRLHHLHPGAMAGVAKSRCTHYRHFKCRPADMTADEWEQRTEVVYQAKMAVSKQVGLYHITDPQGNFFEVRNLLQFCKNHHLSSRSLYMRGGANGWKCKRID